MNSYRVYSDFFVVAIGTMALMLGFLPRIGMAIRFLIGTTMLGFAVSAKKCIEGICLQCTKNFIKFKYFIYANTEYIRANIAKSCISIDATTQRRLSANVL